MSRATYGLEYLPRCCCETVCQTSSLRQLSRPLHSEALDLPGAANTSNQWQWTGDNEWEVSGIYMTPQVYTWHTTMTTDYTCQFMIQQIITCCIPVSYIFLICRFRIQALSVFHRNLLLPESVHFMSCVQITPKMKLCCKRVIDCGAWHPGLVDITWHYHRDYRIPVLPLVTNQSPVNPINYNNSPAILSTRSECTVRLYPCVSISLSTQTIPLH